jgi:hypothetical protein
LTKINLADKNDIFSVVIVPFSRPGQMGCLSDFILGLSSNLLDGFVAGLFSITHHEDFSVALKVRL